MASRLKNKLPIRGRKRLPLRGKRARRAKPLRQYKVGEVYTFPEFWKLDMHADQLIDLLTELNDYDDHHRPS